MSPNVGNFVHDLVEMAKAMETLPGVQAELEAARHDADVARQRIQSLELRLIDRANEIDTLHASVRSAEEARDEATQAFLNADDRTEKALRLVKSFMAEAGSFFQALEPTKPEPIPEPMVSVQVDPTPVQDVPISTGTENAASVSEPHALEDREPASPIAPSTDGPIPSPDTAPTDAVATVADAPESSAEWHAEPTPLPYAGRKWSEVMPRVYNFTEWCEGGGTSENFNL